MGDQYKEDDSMERMDQNMPFLLKYENVAWYENGRVRILDRRVFPTEVALSSAATTVRSCRPSPTW